MYSPLSYKLFIEKTARSLIDYGAAVPPNMTGAWMATDKFIKDKPQVLQKTLNALYGGLAFLQDPKNRAAAIKLIAEIDEIPDNIAEAELDGNIVKLSKDGAMQKDWMNLALDLARMIGMTDLAPVEDIYIDDVQAGADDGVRCFLPGRRERVATGSRSQRGVGQSRGSSPARFAAPSPRFAGRAERQRRA